MRNISNSEVTSWLSCRMQYYFAHFRNIEPKSMSVPLYRGNVGHEAFQRYAEARIEGNAHDQAMRAATNVFITAMRTEPSMADTILETKSIFDRYQAYHQGWPNDIRLIDVEKRFDLPLNDEMNMTIRYDAMAEDVKSGKILIGDYKFTYDFWTTDDHNLNGQMPKYISVMNANGIRVDGGFLEELRTRNLSVKNGKANDPKELWRRTRYFPSNAKKYNTMKQHITAGFEIVKYWDATDEERETLSVPVLNKHGACKFCNFKELCASKLDGGDIEYAIETQFKPNTYGYNNEEPSKELL